ncbi:MAG TPA: 2-hydroxy-3-oxopropionate reductase [Clostridiales bacterium]|nr:2-hydroxy-3-oxopropionate reductase [Clostridiales bacterium]
MKPIVGVVGLGIMGQPMARNLLKAGYPVIACNRTRSRMACLTDMGAEAACSPAEVARKAEIIITMVSDTPDVKQVILGEEGVAAGACEQSVVIDMSTISPSTTREISRILADRGIAMLDAPVSGGEKGAIEGTLSIMAGGPEEVFRRCLPVFQAMGKNIVYMGESGSGQIAKLCNQAACSLTILSVAEALILGARAGLDLEALLKAISGGAAGSWSMSNLGPKIIDGNFAPGFMVDLHQKDLRLVLQAAGEFGVSLPGTALVHQLFNAVQRRCDGGRLGNQALILALEDLAGVEARRR